MRLGAVEYLVRGADEMATFQQAQRLGFEGVEVMLTRDQLRAPGQERLKRLQQACQASGLAVPSLMLGEHNHGGLASADPTVAEAAAEDIRQAIRWAAELGAKVILVPFFFQGEIVTEADFERAVQGFRQLCPVAAEVGVRLCYEGTLPASDIRRMAAEVSSNAFGCYFDLANVVWRGMDTATEIRALGDLIQQVHMKDARVGPGDCPPGLGLVDYAESARALHEIGFDGWIVMETPAGPAELITRDISFTRFCFPELLKPEPWPRLGAFSREFQRGEWQRLIERFRELGLSAVQLSGELLLEALNHPSAVPSLRAQLEENGITVVGLAGYRNLIAPKASKRQENLDFLKRCLELAPLFGTGIVATETGTLHPEHDWLPVHENWSDQAWSLLCESLEELLPVAEKHGSILALEGYVNHVLCTHGRLIGLFERFPSPHLRLVLDPYNYLSRHLIPARERITAELLRRFEHRFVLAHLKDVSAEGAEVATPEFGQGVFPQQLYLDFLRTRRPDLPIILEHLPLAHIPAAIQRLRELVAMEERPQAKV
ncbi:MAG: sugar phosphate isomerase/epimerase family protein [Anaerolineae bacterium]|nr:TIM barrel protein [Anaerolineae bacterium]MDW8099349.1 sugar phosphate isomerase/epimerase family protein [Anaerolineae bacterium]